MPEGARNRLSGEKSPYLLQHSQNPVDWFPWGDEATKKAKNDGKPILLSIGYSTCHWCHQMRKESFEDPKVAHFINKHFVPVKVDREERPEVDSYYMSAIQGMTGQGGWPLTVFLTPELKAFYGGTYYPPEPRYGMPSFMQVLEFVTKLWKDSRGEVTNQADQISKAILETQKITAGAALSPEILDDGFSSLAASYDAEYGGFGRAPKFPMPASLEYMLTYHFRTRKELALRTAIKTLTAMSCGGIRDHIGGGFHRYSTDRIWLVPHFEKMLYDNALLAVSYIHAYQAVGDPTMAEVARETLGWMLTEMESEEGGFFSAEDADTDDGEGVYYTWTPDEVKAVLGEKESERFCRVYGVTKNGDFEGGRSIIHVTEQLEQSALHLGMSSEKLVEALGVSKKLLYSARLKRPRPAVDTKILTSWNGLAISALAKAYNEFADERYGRAAEKAAKFILAKSVKDGELLRRHAGGEAGISGNLEDYAFLGLGLLDLFEVTSEPSWLESSVSLAEKMLGLFEDTGDGGFYSSTSEIPARLVEIYDGPLPSGNSAAIMLLVRLSTITGIERFGKSAERALRRFQPSMDKEPTSHAFMLLSVDAILNGSREVVVSARSKSEAGPFVGRLRGSFLPDLSSFVLTDSNFGAIAKLTPLAEGRAPRAKPLAYVCQNFTCKLPASTPSELAAQLVVAQG